MTFLVVTAHIITRPPTTDSPEYLAIFSARLVLNLVVVAVGLLYAWIGRRLSSLPIVVAGIAVAIVPLAFGGNTTVTIIVGVLFMLLIMGARIPSNELNVLETTHMGRVISYLLVIGPTGFITTAIVSVVIMAPLETLGLLFIYIIVLGLFSVPVAYVERGIQFVSGDDDIGSYPADHSTHTLSL